MYPKWAGSLYLAAAAHNGWDILGVGTESWGTEYSIFDLKHTVLFSKLHCTASGLRHNLWLILLSNSPTSEIDVDPSPKITYADG